MSCVATFFFFAPRPGSTNDNDGEEALLVLALYEPLLRRCTLPLGVTFVFRLPEFAR